MERDNNRYRYRGAIRGFLCGALVVAGVSCAASEGTDEEIGEVADSVSAVDASKGLPKKLLRFVREFDMDGGGGLPAGEMLGERARELFAAADADGDGKINEAELRAWLAKKRAIATKKKKEKEQAKEIELKKRVSLKKEGGESNGR